MKHARQTGFFLIEAMVAVLIFALGILGMVALGGTAANSQNDARYRADASALADEIAGVIALNVDRTTDTTLNTSVAAFQHMATGAPDTCAFSGGASGNADVVAWATKAYTTGYGAIGLPGATASQQQIVVDNTSDHFNQVTITVCWKPKTGEAWRHHTLVTYIN